MFPKVLFWSFYQKKTTTGFFLFNVNIDDGGDDDEIMFWVGN